MSTKKSDKKSLAAGLKRTPQRLAIIDYLDGNISHPSADDIYRSVSKKYHSMSFATVYNTLNTLAQAGAVRELSMDPGRKRYDPNTVLHHHLMCLSCKKIVDVSGEVTVDLPRGFAEGFTVLGSHVEFHGYCSSCKKKRKIS